MKKNTLYPNWKGKPSFQRAKQIKCQQITKSTTFHNYSTKIETKYVTQPDEKHYNVPNRSKMSNV
jgi:hypothetical protein